MTHRGALLFVAVVGAVLLTWAAARYSRQFDASPQAAGEAAAASERASA